MKVKQLIEELRKQDPEKEVMIQQGEEYDYMIAHTVKQTELVNMDSVCEDEEIEVVVIEYC